MTRIPRRFVALTVALLAAAHGACGADGLSACDGGLGLIACEELSEEEQARAALDEGDWDTAIEKLTALLEATPEEHRLRPLLAAALAARGRFRILDIIKGAGDGAGGDAINAIGSYLPDPVEAGDAYGDYLRDVEEAVFVLLEIPSELRSETAAEAYASSARMQLGLYQAAASIMHLNQFMIRIDEGGLDPDALSRMSDEDAAKVLDNLAQAAANQGDSALGAKVEQTLAAVDATPGETQREKLTNYVVSRNGQS